MKWRKKPILTLDVGRYVEVGFTELGPVLNLAETFTSDQNILVSLVEIIITHESGARYDFLWHEISEVKGQMVSSNAGIQPIYQLSEAIAMKILATDFKYVLLRNRLDAHTERLHNLNAPTSL